MFEGFTQWDVEVANGVTVHGRSGGAGPPVALLHGHPRTHATWCRLAPLLVAAGHTVVCPDLRGYGRSVKPGTTPDHAPCSKRSMAADVAQLMQALGHERFSVVGHDRGSYVAMRLALDRPDAVAALAVLDRVPIGEALSRVYARFAVAWWHWFFYAADYRQAIRNPATVRAMLEDYRAGLRIDRAHDDADRANGHRIDCPALVVWSTQDDLPALYGDALAIWGPWGLEQSAVGTADG